MDILPRLLSFFRSRKESYITTTILRGFALFYLLYLCIFMGVLVLSGRPLFLYSDHIFLLIGSFIVITGRGGAFLASFSRYFILLMSYEGMRGVADNLNQFVTFDMPIIFDRFIGCGRIPTEILQTELASYAPFLDAFTSLNYVLHFFVPFLFGLLLWIKRRDSYDQYFLTLIIVAYLSLLTFLAMPIAPPWLAAEKGLVDTTHILLDSENVPDFLILPIPSLYYLFNANPVAAFPSLHFAFPVLVALFALKAFRWKGLPFLIYPMSMGFSLIYLGEHYVFDLLGGVLYVSLAFFVSSVVLSAYHEGRLVDIYRLV